MKWIYGIQTDEPEATASMPMLPDPALFPAVLPPAPRLRLASSAMSLIKIDSRVSGKC